LEGLPNEVLLQRLTYKSKESNGAISGRGECGRETPSGGNKEILVNVLKSLHKTHYRKGKTPTSVMGPLKDG